MVKDLSNEIYAYALQNALLFKDARASAVLPKLFKHGLKKQDIGKIFPAINKIVEEINNLSENKQNKEFEKYKMFLKEKSEEEKGLKELPNVRGKPVFRMAPFPSGSLHIGNAKTYLLNALYAEKYNGKVLLVIDDTAGSAEKRIMPEAYSLIPEAFDWLGVKYEKPIIYKSDRLEIYYKYAKQLIKKNKAYVCSCSQEELRQNRVDEKECECRKLSIKENLERWEKMFDAHEGDYILRIKTSMVHKNPAFRDRVLFRIVDREHFRTGHKYNVWPMLEFSWAVDDHLLKITHIIRGKELMIEGEMQKYLWKIFKWKSPELIYVGLVKLEGIGGKLSKSKAQQEVLSGEYSGWDDPRTWSIQSLKRRGILAESIREFVEKIGLNQKEISIPIDDLYAINRRHIDLEADRYFFVENPVKILIENPPRLNHIKIKIHPEKTKTKTLEVDKELVVSLEDFNKLKGKEVRLMHLYNIKLDKKSEFTSKEMKRIQKIHWLAEGVKTKIRMPDSTYKFGLAEKNIQKLKNGAIIQFERFGFCRFDNVNNSGEYEFWFCHD